MDQRHLELIANDEKEVRDPITRATIAAKLAYYRLERPFMNNRLRRRLTPLLKDDPVFQRVNLLLNDEGGMFKKHVYGLCERFRPIKGASVLVPGVGYARNLLQLAVFRPKEIVAFDLFEYSDIWEMLTKKIRAEFGVPTTFLKGDFDVLPPARRGSFDFVISDAVLEHVPDMPKFAADSWNFLKPGGAFYASFGPLWHGPSGDHVTWGPERLFDHLLLPEADYKRQLRERSLEVVQDDSCDPGFMIQEDFFSYLKAQEYLDQMKEAGFDIFDLRAKISSAALRLLQDRPDIAAALDARGEPAFDRFSSGLYLWARKQPKT